MRTRANLLIEILIVLTIIGVIGVFIFPKSQALNVASCFASATLMFACYFHDKAQKKQKAKSEASEGIPPASLQP